MAADFPFNGADAAYDRLVAAAFEFGASRVRTIAAELTHEAREHIIGCAAYDIEHKPIEQRWPIRIVFRTLTDMARQS